MNRSVPTPEEWQDMSVKERMEWFEEAQPVADISSAVDLGLDEEEVPPPETEWVTGQGVEVRR